MAIENVYLNSLNTALGILLPTSATVLQVLILAIIAALVLSPLEHLVPAYPQSLFWRKGILLDVAYWFLTPIMTRTFTGIILSFVFAAAVVHLNLGSTAGALQGFGPVAQQPLLLQAIEILVLADFVDYWTHRCFHERYLWRIHAIHHSPEEMSWLSSARVHPLNDLITRSFQMLPLVLFGFSAHAMVAVVPLISFYVMFLHSNIRWDFGPLRWVLVSPAFHRWHHTSDNEGIDKNFAGIFPIWDLLFGTSYFPKDALPKKYGVRNEEFPHTLLGQMLYPFQPPPPPVASNSKGKSKAVTAES